MTLFQAAVLALLAGNVFVTYLMLKRLTIATLTGSFAVAHMLNPVRAKWFERTHAKLQSIEPDDPEYETLSTQFAEANPDCRAGREALIASAFDTYQECRRVPDKYRHLDKNP